MFVEFFYKFLNVIVKKKGKLIKRRYMGFNSYLSKLKSCRIVIELLFIVIK